MNRTSRSLFAFLRHQGNAAAILVATILAVGWGASHAQAAPIRVGPVEVELLGEQRTIQPGKPFTVGLRLAADAGWHTYWHNPGDAGQATTIAWRMPPGFTAGEIQWPAPSRFAAGPVTSFGYEGTVLLLTEIVPPADLPAGAELTIDADVAWLVCSDQCMPGEANLSLALRVATEAGAAEATTSALFATARRRVPRPADAAWHAEFSATGHDLTLTLAVPPDAALEPAETYFFVHEAGLIDHSQPVRIESEDGKLLVHLRRAEDAGGVSERLAGVLVTRRGDATLAVTIDAARAAPARATGAGTLLGAIFPAFLGGVILNLMPCVFPVLGVKILGFVHQAGADRRKVTLHGLVFTAGVLLSFWLLAGGLIALRAGGEQLGWGFQLQSPAFVFSLTAFLLVFGLNLSGAFEFGLAATRVGGSLQMRSGYAGSFFTGVLVTLVSTPCAAPFLASALGAALALPAASALLLFTVIALGLSAPYLVLSIFPRLVKVLPRPGAWMESFKQFMAFPLYATVAFLVWVLAGQVGETALLNALAGLVLVALAAWSHGRWTQRGGGRARRVAGHAFAVLALAGGIAVGWPRSAAPEIVWRDWSPEAVSAMQAEGRIVYVDFTARWCATCKVNKLAVFGSPQVREVFARDGIVPLKADWTRKDPAITRALEDFGRSAVPFNLVYGPAHREPIVLPEVLTPGIVLDALARARPPVVANAR